VRASASRCRRSKCRRRSTSGGSRGIGKEIVRGLARANGINTVIFTSTDAAKGTLIAEEFRKEFPTTKIAYYQLDCSKRDSLDAFVRAVLKDYDHVDILVNNAGMMDHRFTNTSIFEQPIEEIHPTLDVNTFAPLILIQGFIGKMKERNWGRIVNMSSGAGQLDDMFSFNVPYRLSKTALNAITRMAAHELKDKNILVNTMCPGFVDTDMTAHYERRATKTPAQGADTAVWLATLPDDGPRGKFFRDRKPIPW